MTGQGRSRVGYVARSRVRAEDVQLVGYYRYDTAAVDLLYITGRTDAALTRVDRYGSCASTRPARWPCCWSVPDT